MTDALDPRLWQALIAGGVVALGWLVNGWRVRTDARRMRAERLRDAHKALFAEIRDVCAAYWKEGEADAFASAIVARMRAEPDFVPFVPREVHGRVFEAMLPQIDVLPRQTIDAIVAFYALVASIQGLAEDMRGAGFATMGQGRRIAMIEDYVALRRRAFTYGKRTLKLISAYADGGAPAAERLLARFSRPDADRSSPEGSGTA
ncbi:hypothetical protein JQC91_13345 [Jannaschia sp. Os4]|uniref:hypothetical protein n=1 Tax=Jannaschia sp. Os4 TaxID=2807617 RepID=UPI00193935F0|nr:hypothetical protein [Jannaschia sp. Os4]MBM2577288.1 hypothetical protein [Jannaschia sp. Os4]